MFLYYKEQKKERNYKHIFIQNTLLCFEREKFNSLYGCNILQKNEKNTFLQEYFQVVSFRFFTKEIIIFLKK